MSGQRFWVVCGNQYEDVGRRLWLQQFRGPFSRSDDAYAVAQQLNMDVQASPAECEAGLEFFANEESDLLERSASHRVLVIGPEVDREGALAMRRRLLHRDQMSSTPSGVRPDFLAIDRLGCVAGILVDNAVLDASGRPVAAVEEASASDAPVRSVLRIRGSRVGQVHDDGLLTSVTAGAPIGRIQTDGTVLKLTARHQVLGIVGRIVPTGARHRMGAAAMMLVHSIINPGRLGP